MKIKKSELKETIKEELELVRLEQIMLAEKRRIDKLHEEMRLELLFAFYSFRGGILFFECPLLQRDPLDLLE